MRQFNKEQAIKRLFELDKSYFYRAIIPGDPRSSWQISPTEEFDLDRWLSQGRPDSWRVRRQKKRIDQPRAHIINDPLLLLEDEDHLRRYFVTFSQFGIYIVQGDALVRVNTFPEFKFLLKKITPIPPKIIYKLAEKYSLSSKVIDYAEHHILFNNLFNVDENGRYFENHKKYTDRHVVPIDIQDFRCIDDKILNATLDIFPKTKPVALSFNDFYFRSKDICKKILHTFQVHDLSLDLKNFPQSTKEFLLAETFSLQKISQFSIKGLTSLDKHFLEILFKLPNLEVLRINKIRDDSGELIEFKAATAAHFPWENKLKKLELEGITPTFLYSLPNLRIISVRDVNINWEQLAKSSPNLEEIILNEVRLSDLVKILGLYPNLQRLKIIGEIKFDIDLGKTTWLPHNLNELSIQMPKINQLIKLLKVFPNLKHLRIDDKLSVAEPVTENPSGLPNLDELELNGRMYDENLQRINNLFPRARIKLDVSVEKKQKLPPTPKILPPSEETQLEPLSTAATYLSLERRDSKTIKEILEKYPNIIGLHLRKCKLNEETSFTSVTNLESLETESRISIKLIASLLDKSPRIKFVNLSDALTDESEILSFSPLFKTSSFPELRSLAFSPDDELKDTQPENLVIELLSKSPALKQIILRMSGTSISQCEDTISRLQHLERINLNWFPKPNVLQNVTNLFELSLTLNPHDDLEQLGNILKKATNLKILRLEFKGELDEPKQKQLSDILLTTLPKKKSLKTLEIISEEGRCIEQDTAYKLKDEFPNALISLGAEDERFDDQYLRYKESRGLEGFPTDLLDVRLGLSEDEKDSPLLPSTLPISDFTPNKSGRLSSSKLTIPEYILGHHDQFHCRLNVMDKLVLDKEKGDCLKIHYSLSHDSHLKRIEFKENLRREYELHYADHNEFVYIQKTLALKPGEWCMLPSYSASDDIRYYEASAPLRFCYDPHTNQHYVMLEQKDSKDSKSSEQKAIVRNVTIGCLAKSERGIVFKDPVDIDSKEFSQYVQQSKALAPILQFNRDGDSLGVSFVGSSKEVSEGVKQATIILAKKRIKKSDNVEEHIQQLNALTLAQKERLIADALFLDFAIEFFNTIEFYKNEKNAIVWKIPDKYKAYSKEILFQAVIWVAREIFEPKEFEFPQNGIKYLNSIIKEKTGACDARSFLVKAVADQLAIPARVVLGVGHAFVEYQPNLKSPWCPVDMGGYPFAGETRLDMPRQTLSEQKHQFIPPKTTKTSSSFSFPSLFFSRDAKSDEKKKVVIPLKSQKKSIPEFYQSLMKKLNQQQARRQNALLGFSDGNRILAAAGELMAESKRQGHNSFYIDDLSQIGSQTFAIKDAKSSKVPSRLVQFLQQAKPDDLLIINYSKRSGVALANLNSALDEARQLLGQSIPPNVKIVVLTEKDQIDPSQNDLMRRCPIKTELDEKSIDEQVAIPADFIAAHCTLKSDEKTTTKINLFGGEYWQSDLFGQPELEHKTGFTFQLGALSQLDPSLNVFSGQGVDPKQASEVERKSVTPPANIIEIANANLNDPEFRAEIVSLIAQGKVFYNGREFELPRGTKFVFTEEKYDFSNYQNIRCTKFSGSGLKDRHFVLHSENYIDFLRARICEDHNLLKSPGIIQQQATKTITIRVIESLDNGYWARLFAHAAKFDVKLNLVFNENVTLPTGLQFEGLSRSKVDDEKFDDKKSETLSGLIPLKDAKDISQLTKNAFSVVVSAEPYQSAIDLAKCIDDKKQTPKMTEEKDEHTLVVQVNKSMTYADLIETLSINTDIVSPVSIMPRFNRITSQIATALTGDPGKTVILTGDFSPELAAKLSSIGALQPYLQLNGRQVPVTGHLIIVTENQELFSTANVMCSHQPSPPIILHVPKPEPKIGVEVGVIDQKDHKDQKDQKDQKDEKQTRTIISIDIASDEKEMRLKNLCNKLDILPCVFVNGPTGTGKSSLVRGELPTFYQKRSHNSPVLKTIEGLKNLEKWVENAQKESNTTWVLMIDEADLMADGTFDIFEGAFAEDPYKQIWVKEKLQSFPWLPNMKVIFNGNTTAYSARQNHKFFNHHLEMNVDFPAYSRKYIESYVLFPLLKELLRDVGVAGDIDFGRILENFFTAEKFIKPPQILSIRNYDQMAFRLRLLLTSYQKILNPEQAMAFATYDEISEMLDSTQRQELQNELFGSTEVYEMLCRNLDEFAADQFRQRLAERQKQDLTALKLDEKDQKQGLIKPRRKFTLTKSHYRATRLLQDQLSLAEFRRGFHSSNPHYATKGQRALILEGSAGIGKSALIRNLLLANGYCDESSLPPADTPAHKIFYNVTHENIEEKIKLARTRGCLVIFDEINADFTEDKLNPVATGVDDEGATAEKEGFILLGTQNPPKNAHRIQQSNAFKNRFPTLEIPELSESEIREILKAEGLPDDRIKRLMEQYYSHPGWTLSELLDRSRTLLDMDDLHLILKEAYTKYAELYMESQLSIDQSLLDFGAITGLDFSTEQDKSSIFTDLSLGKLLAFMLGGVGNWQDGSRPSIKNVITKELITLLNPSEHRRIDINLFKMYFKEAVFLQLNLSETRKAEYRGLSEYISELLDHLFSQLEKYNNHNPSQQHEAKMVQDKIINVLDTLMSFKLDGYALPDLIKAAKGPEVKHQEVLLLLELKRQMLLLEPSFNTRQSAAKSVAQSTNTQSFWSRARDLESEPSLSLADHLYLDI